MRSAIPGAVAAALSIFAANTGRISMRFEDSPMSPPPSVPLSRWWAELGLGNNASTLYGAVARASSDVVPAATRDMIGTCVPTTAALPAATTFEMTLLGPAGFTPPLVLR